MAGKEKTVSGIICGTEKTQTALQTIKGREQPAVERSWGTKVRKRATMMH